MPPQPTLIVFGGLPGTGKTTLAKALARSLGATYLRLDSIEQAIRRSGIVAFGAAGYAVANDVAEDNLTLGLVVVVDCVNPVEASRLGWADVAARAGVPLVEIEITCSDRLEHRRRVETRTADIPGHRVPNWLEVMRHEFEPWHGRHLVLDTAGAVPEALLTRCEAYLLDGEGDRVSLGS